jgi:hypothetical protein
MNFSASPTPNRDESTERHFDIERFKTLLSDLKESKKQKEDKAKPTYEPEE